jgi:arginine decarboxylase
MLDYVGYALPELRRAYRDKVAAAQLPAAEAEALLAALEAGLTGYTYLHEHEPGT